MATPRSSKTVLLVDDEQGFLASLVAGLSELEGIEFLTARDGQHALDVLAGTPADLVVTDLRMPGMSGFDLLARLADETPRIPALVMTAFGTPEMEAELDALGVMGYVEKPIDIGQLAARISAVLAGHEPASGARPFPRTADAVRIALYEAAAGGLDGEVLVRCGALGGRVYLCGGAVAWAVASTTGQTLSSRLTQETGVRLEELRAVYQECKRAGVGFARTLVDWGLLDEATVRRVLVDHVGHGLAELLSWPEPDVMFVPERRSSDGSFLFALEEVLGHAERHRRSRPRVPTEAEQEPAPAPSPAPTAPAHRSTSPGEDMQAQRIKEQLEVLRSVDGFVGAAVFIPSGELVAEASASSLHLGELGALANDVLLKSQKTTDIMGVGRGNQIQVTAPKATIFVRCLNENTDFAANEPGRAHVHMMLILAPEGNLALGKMQLEKVIQQVAPLMR